VEGSIAAITSDSMYLTRSDRSTGVGVRDLRWVGTPLPASRTNGAIVGAQQGLTWGVLIGMTGAVVMRTIGSNTPNDRTTLILATVSASSLGGAAIGAARRSTRWRKVAKPRWPHGADSVCSPVCTSSTRHRNAPEAYLPQMRSVMQR